MTILKIDEALYRLNKRAKEIRDDLRHKSYEYVHHPDTGEYLHIDEVKEDLESWINNCQSDLDAWTGDHEWANSEEDLEDSIAEYNSFLAAFEKEIENKKENLIQEKESIYELKNQALLKLKKMNELEIIDSHYFPIGEFTLVKIKNSTYTFHIDSDLIEAPEDSECKNLDLIDSKCDSNLNLETAYQIVKDFINSEN